MSDVLWSDMDDETARQADEAEVVLKPILAKSFGEDATLSRDRRFGEYTLRWTRTDLVGGANGKRQDYELFLFGEEDRTTHAMLWNAMLWLNQASSFEENYFKPTPLSRALGDVSDGIFDYIKTKWEQA